MAPKSPPDVRLERWKETRRLIDDSTLEKVHATLVKNRLLRARFQAASLVAYEGASALVEELNQLSETLALCEITKTPISGLILDLCKRIDTFFRNEVKR